jgi:hypothetical protein
MKTYKKAETDINVFDLNVPDQTLAGMVTRRASDANGYWEKKYNLTKVRERNKELYTTDYVKKWLLDERYQDIFADNRLFTSTRTILPFVSSRMTKPEVTPAKETEISRKFAKDFEKILVEEATSTYLRDKSKLCVQDLLTGQRIGVGKWVYDVSKGCLAFEHLDPASVTFGRRSKLHEEFDFVQHRQMRTAADLVRQFPSKKEMIYKEFGIIRPQQSQLEKEKEISENWLWYEEDDGSKELVVIYMLGNRVLGGMYDPNWVRDGSNLIEYQMIPFVTYNYLNDGSGYIDETSLIEQAQYSQKNYDKRGMTIQENAAYAGIGVPVFGKGAVKEETAARVRFSPTQRIMLDTEDVNKGFTTWQAGQLPHFIVEDKYDLRNNVDNIYGTPSVMRGEQSKQSKNNTLGQDVLLRNQAEGRQMELVDCIDNAMQRSYQIEAQLIYRYFDKEKYYNFLGEDGEFEQIVISQKKISDNIGCKIGVQSGSNLPVDRSQRLATVFELLKAGRIGTLRLYKEIGLDNPEEAYREYLEEKLLPFKSMEDAKDTIISTEAEMDLQTVIGGGEAIEREDVTEAYIQHINDYLMTNKYHQLEQKQQQAVTKFVADIIAQAKRKELKMQTQQGGAPSNSSSQIPPDRKTQAMMYRNAPPDVQAEIEINQGLKPSSMHAAEIAAGIAHVGSVAGTQLVPPQQPQQ